MSTPPVSQQGIGCIEYYKYIQSTYAHYGFCVLGGGLSVEDLPKEYVEAKHSEHDSQVSQDTNGVA